MSDDGNTRVRIGPEPGARGADRGIPLQELCGRDGALTRYGIARLVVWHQVKRVAIIHHAGLRGCGSCNAVGWLGWCWCS